MIYNSYALSIEKDAHCENCSPFIPGPDCSLGDSLSDRSEESLQRDGTRCQSLDRSGEGGNVTQHTSQLLLLRRNRWLRDFSAFQTMERCKNPDL